MQKIIKLRPFKSSYQKVKFKTFLEKANKANVTLELLQFVVKYQVGAFPDLVLDFQKILDTILQADSWELHSVQKFEMAKYLLDTQNTHFPDQKVNCKGFLERQYEDDRALDLVKLLVNHQMQVFPDDTLDWKNDNH